MGETEKRVRELIERYTLLEEIARQLSERVRLLETIYGEVTTTITTLEELGKTTVPRETLLPIGGAIYLFGEVKRFDKVLLNVGSGVVLEKTPEEALEFLNLQKQEVAKELENSRSRLRQVLMELDKIRELVQTLRQAAEAPG
ncbi:MAG: prefoldin subunit alpha [Thermoproteales archaeon]|nr:prefoldin subunit alpha [Thermoproteales archaeon]